MGSKVGVYLLALAVLAMAANMTYVTTPSGKIHITYVDNGTYIVVNINDKVITANIKLNVTVAGEQYYLHVVGLAKGYFDNATISKLASLLNQTKSPDALLAALKILADYNQTKELRVKAMLSARAINASAPNATYLKAKIEYELERRLSRLNKTLTAEDEWEIKIMFTAGNPLTVTSLGAYLMVSNPPPPVTTATLRPSKRAGTGTPSSSTTGPHMGSAGRVTLITGTATVALNNINTVPFANNRRTQNMGEELGENILVSYLPFLSLSSDLPFLPDPPLDLSSFSSFPLDFDRLFSSLLLFDLSLCWELLSDSFTSLFSEP